jgi:signal transduction histidine kinase/CHASE3 domain sensor protein/ActR/RegA family two-component response regulator
MRFFVLLGSIRFRLAASIGALLVLLLAVSWTFHESFGRFDRAVQGARTAREASRGCRELSRTLVDAESGQRGYVITGREEYLRSYREALRRSDANRADVRSALATDPVLAQRSDSLDRLVGRKLDELAVTITVRRTDGPAAATKLVEADDGRILMDDIRIELDGIMAQLDIEAAGIERTLIIERDKFDRVLFVAAFGSILLFLAVGMILSKSITGPLGELAQAARRIGEGRFDERIPIRGDDEATALARAFNDMASQLASARAISEEHDWIQEELAKTSVWLQECATLEELGEKVLSPLVLTLGASQGTLFVRAEDDGKVLERRWVFAEDEKLPRRIAYGEGLVGAVARDGKPVVRDGGDLGTLLTGTGMVTLRAVALVAARFENETFGVLEIGVTTPLAHRAEELLRRTAEPLGLALRAFRTQEALRRALASAQVLSEELKRHTDELIARGRQLQEANVTLEEQRSELIYSEKMLREQQQELYSLNEELEVKAQLLTAQNNEYERKNKELETARAELGSKAEQLEKVSRIKSEFLANVSHELRTPLNSQLILSKILVENKDGNLSEKQVDYLRTIYTAGIDLLRLIDDVLDLSKIEAGRLDVHVAPVTVSALASTLDGTFSVMAREKNLTLEVVVAREGEVVTDVSRLRQILTNLVGNALKFTHEGGVCVRMSVQEDMFVATVEDTGIGIPANQQELIFEPFRQGDGSTSRAYGGTGLGLSISRQLATLLGGTIRLVRSQAGVARDAEGPGRRGSTFCVRLPRELLARDAERPSETAIRGEILTPVAPEFPSRETAGPLPQGPVRSRPPANSLAEASRETAGPLPQGPVRSRPPANSLAEASRETPLQQGPSSSRSPAKLQAAMARETAGLSVRAPRSSPTLVRVRTDSPLHGAAARPVAAGADGRSLFEWSLAGTLVPLRGPREGRPLWRGGLSDEAGNSPQGALGILLIDAPIGAGAPLAAAAVRSGFHPTAIGRSLLHRRLTGTANDEENLLGIRAVVFFSAATEPTTGDGRTEPDAELIGALRSREVSVYIAQGSTPTVLAEAGLFLQRLAELPPDVVLTPGTDPRLAGRRVLVVDDDIRNVFALTALLERHGVRVAFSESGDGALELLRAGASPDAILLDMMMPKRDGFSTLRELRSDPEFHAIPVIAVTAAAMPGDRERCLEAGASDYVTKPVDVDQLVAILTEWLRRRDSGELVAVARS